MNCKLAGREQLAAQGVSGRQVHKGVAGGSQRRGSVASPVMIDWSRTRAAEMEKLLEDGINSIGLGPQGMSGKNSVMGVHIENTARHPSTIGVAVNVGCWSHRRGHVVFDKDLNATVTTHSGVQL